MFRVESPHRKMTSLIRISFVVDNLHYLLNACIIVGGETRSKLSGPATPNYEGNYPPLFYVENTKISLYVESPHRFNIFSESVRKRDCYGICNESVMARSYFCHEMYS